MRVALMIVAGLVVLIVVVNVAIDRSDMPDEQLPPYPY